MANSMCRVFIYFNFILSREIFVPVSLHVAYLSEVLKGRQEKGMYILGGSNLI